jgi:hypothetical protein
VLDDPLLSGAAVNDAPTWSKLEDDLAVTVIGLAVADIIYWGYAGI